jgi:hypothetical protein
MEQVFVVETDELIHNSLFKLRVHLEESVDADTKETWLDALKKCPHQLTDDKHLLMFLRCEVFQIERGGKRLCKYWKKRKQVFGPVKPFNL